MSQVWKYTTNQVQQKYQILVIVLLHEMPYVLGEEHGLNQILLETRDNQNWKPQFEVILTI